MLSQVPVEMSQIDFWFDLLDKARRGASREAGPDFLGGAMILSLLHAFCSRHAQPATANQNLIALKLVLSPASDTVERLHVLAPGRLAEVTTPSAEDDLPSPCAARAESSSRVSRCGSAALSLLCSSGGAAQSAAQMPTTAALVHTALVPTSSASSVTLEAVSPPNVGTDTAESPHALARRDRDRNTSRSSVSLVHKALRPDSLRPLQGLASHALDEDVHTDKMRGLILERPALLCVVQRRTRRELGSAAGRRASISARMSIREDADESFLCLSPFHPRHGEWTPLTRLAEMPEKLEYYLRELKLLGGLCCGYNGLTVHTVRSLYPFEVRALRRTTRRTSLMGTVGPWGGLQFP